MLSSYLNQTARYRPAIRDEGGMATDERGQAQYGGETTVPCRRQPKVKETLSADGQAVRITTAYFLSQQVFEGDMLDDRRIAAVSQWNTLGGGAAGWRADCE